MTYNNTIQFFITILICILLDSNFDSLDKPLTISFSYHLIRELIGFHLIQNESYRDSHRFICQIDFIWLIYTPYFTT